MLKFINLEDCVVRMGFADNLKRLREKKGLSSSDLAAQMYVSRSTVSRWENGSRLPDAAMLSRLSEILGVDVDTLLAAAAQSDEHPNVIIVDDVKPIVNGGVSVLEEVMPTATVTGFTKASDAIEYAKENRVAFAVLDIELGGVSGLELCRELLEINPRTNVVYLTAFREYSFDAWETGACGFMTKPLTPDAIRKQLTKLRYPFWVKGADV